jgi:hypothetical protein
MSAETDVARVKRWTAIAAVLVVAGGCASGAWRFADDGPPLAERDPPSLTFHRAVEHVTLRVHGHEMEFVGYRSYDTSRVVREQLLLESGISVLDVAVHRDEDRRISGSVFESIPNFAETVMEDLRRTWGSRSVFDIGLADLFGGIYSRSPAARPVTDGNRRVLALPVDEGWWLAFDSFDYPTAPLHVTLLDPTLVPQATIAYSEFDDDGVPREIRLVDLRDGHTLDVEVEEVHLIPMAAAATTR